MLVSLAPFNGDGKDDVMKSWSKQIKKLEGGFVKEYMVACKKASLPNIITKSWVKTGICTLNPDIFMDADFAPSASMSRHAHLPRSYPAGHDSNNSNFESGSDSDPDENSDRDGTDSDHDGDGDDGAYENQGLDDEGDNNKPISSTVVPSAPHEHTQISQNNLDSPPSSIPPPLANI
jgi:hypothetical protein